jgi:hypothetical protein
MNATETRIQFLSPPAEVNMADAWFSIAHLDHFWIRRRFNVLRRFAGSLIREARAIAEVGCGCGLLQRQIEDYYHREVTGFDLNDGALKNAISRVSPLCCYNLLDRQRGYRGRFDLILLFDVLEHIEDEDGFLEALQFHLAVGGKVLINIPAGQWLYSDYDRAAGHARRYSIASLRRVANRNRLIVARHTYWGLPFIPLLVLRRLWLLGRTREERIATGFSDRGALMNHLLVLLSGCEPIPQRLLGTSLMAVLEAPSDTNSVSNADLKGGTGAKGV